MSKVNQVTNGMSAATAASYWNEAVRSGYMDVDDFAAAAFKDEDDMASNSAKAVASQQSIKAYVDATASGIVTYASSGAGSSTVTTPTTPIYVHIKTAVTGGGDTLTLPDTASLNTGQLITVVDDSGTAGSNNITIATFGAELISGQATAVIANDYGSYTLFYNGNNFNIII